MTTSTGSSGHPRDLKASGLMVAPPWNSGSGAGHPYISLSALHPLQFTYPHHTARPVMRFTTVFAALVAVTSSTAAFAVPLSNNFARNLNVERRTYARSDDDLPSLTVRNVIEILSARETGWNGLTKRTNPPAGAPPNIAEMKKAAPQPQPKTHYLQTAPPEPGKPIQPQQNYAPTAPYLSKPPIGAHVYENEPEKPMKDFVQTPSPLRNEVE
ncbi:hypothetical protein EIP91_006444 [Steccherinum ochraceum]|uniref:Uncharacterized protein n=1 Tax=Steccherinum ochraceum TaxID=92696 RepID=A0A4R0R866_9APHY|nr:hypothetical protein EIP91_006444 [Steccherinum ochraceum]